MSEEGRSAGAAAQTLTGRDRRWVLLWAAGILALYALAGWFGVRQIHRYRADAESSRLASIASVAIEPLRAGGHGKPAAGTPTLVKTRIDILRVGDFSLRESGWTTDFVVRFQWKGAGLNPGESLRIANGQILQREPVATGTENGERYAAYRVSARVVGDFDPSRFPFANEWLVLQLEDATHTAENLRYVVDDHASEVDLEGLPRSMKLMRHDVAAVLHRGEPGLGAAGGGGVRSRLVLGMLVAPISRSLYMSMFQALFASIAIAMIVFFIKPTHVDPRFGLSVGAFFASVSNNVYIGSILPPAGRLTLASMVNAIGLGTIFLILVQSTISLYVLDSLGRDRLSRFFDRVSFAAMALGCIAVNLALPIAARS